MLWRLRLMQHAFTIQILQMNTYFDTFNPPQRAAVEYCDGPALVIAGAGSGKTRVLTYKIAYLMEKGYQPWNILALTFTNKAAGEMKTRIADIVGTEYARRLWMGTFHSVFLRILRTEHESIGFSANFTIYDAADSKSLVKSIIKEMALDDKTYKPGNVLNAISNAKNQLVTAEEYAANPSNRQMDARANMPALHMIYSAYARRCRQSDAMDFDDILLYTYLLFAKHLDVLDKWASLFKYVLVDEYQDTNFAQHQIVWQLTSRHQHVCVVGDDAQSIYSFRGANIDNILTFCKLYEDARLFKLEQNYRSTQNIVEAANSLISKNSRQIRKEVFSNNDRGDKLHVIDTSSDVEEAKVVANTIRSRKAATGCDYSDFAILYRTNAQSRALEEELRRQQLPYRIYGGLSFYQRKEVKDILAYFRLAVNPNDEEAFRRVINYPARGIGQTTLGKIMMAAHEHETSLWNVIAASGMYGLALSKATLTKIGAFKKVIDSFAEKAMTLKASEIGPFIIKQSGILNDIYQDNSAENLARQENVEELVNGMHNFCDMRLEEGNEHVLLSDYLSEVSLLSDTDNDKDDDGNRVTLMTIHSAKGLEFDTVFVVGLEEGLFPSQMVSGNPREMEEERRLFYVAITRAKHSCYLTYAKCRFRYGKMEFSSPSRFIRDIDPVYLDRRQTLYSSRKIQSDEIELPWKHRATIRPNYVGELDFGHTSSAKPKSVPSQSMTHAEPEPASVPTETPSGLSEGMIMEHNRFGRGKVMKVEGRGDMTKATVEFENTGMKQILLKFAKYTIIK